MPLDIAIVLLFSVATGVAIAVRRFGIPYTVALVVVGIALGATRLVEANLLRRDILFSLFLPALVFEAAYHLEFAELRRRAFAILALSVPGVVLGAFGTAFLLVLGRPVLGADALPFGAALVFGAIVAATDPIAVVALFRALGASRALRVVIEGESLVNDGTGIALFALAVSTMSSGSISYAGAVLAFARILAVGVLVGAVAGGATSAISRRIDDAMIEVTLTVIAAFGSFAVAEHAGGSGVIAAVVAGCICGNYAQASMSERTRHGVTTFWEYIAFAFNSLIFLSMGFAVTLGELARSWRATAFAFVAILMMRTVLVVSVTSVLARTKGAVPWRWAPVLIWGGVRGALSIVLALSLPDAFPHRATIVALTVGVVTATLLLQGTTMMPLARRFGVLEEDAA